MFRSSPFRRLLLLLGGASVLACSGSERSSGPSPVVASIQVTPGADTLVSLGDTRQLTAIPLDSKGDQVPGVTLTWSSSAAGVASVNSSTGLVSAVGNGSAIISASAGGVSGTANLLVAQEVATVTVLPASASLAALGAPQQFTATAKDANGNAVPGAKFLWLSSDQGVATVDTAGKATSRGPGTTTVTAAARGIPGNAGLTVTQVAAKLGFSVSPPNAVAGDPFPTAVEVEVQDAGGTLVAGARLPITLSIPGDTLHGTTTVNSVGGIATFPGLWVDKAANFSLNAAAPGLAGQVALTILPTTPVQLAFLQQPARTHVRTPLAAVTLAGYDRFGNAVPSFAIALALAQNPVGALLGGTTSISASGGVASFNTLTIDSVGRNYAFTATTSFDTVRSDTFVVTPAFTHLSAGQLFSCGLATAGQVFCWGADLDWELGDGGGPNKTRPVPVAAGGIPLSGLSAGGLHACALAAGGAAYCWGDDSYGELGAFCNSAACLPLAVVGAPPLASVVAGFGLTCGLTSGGTAYCWGANIRGSIGAGDTTTGQNVPPSAVAGGLNFTSLSVSRDLQGACGLLAGGAAYCWGDNSLGQLGIGTADTLAHEAPAPVVGGHHFDQIIAGALTCGHELNGSVYCWGNNGGGGLGIGSSDTLPHPTPTQVAGGFSFTRVAVGQSHACGDTGNNTWLCWGDNSFGQLGTGDVTPHYTPTPVSGSHAFVELSASAIGVCGLTAQSDVWCWGYNVEGEVGDGTTTTRLVPTLVDP